MRWPVLLFLLSLLLPLPAQERREIPEKKRAKVGTDILLVSGLSLTALTADRLINGRLGELKDASLERVWNNLKDPWNRAVEGGRRDNNPFFTNYVMHPISWSSLALYLRARGYTTGQALLFTQVHSVVWEYILEGSLWYPSGKDLVTNLAASSAALLVLSPLSDLGERRCREGRCNFGYRILRALNPFKPLVRALFPNQTGLIAIVPGRGGGASLSFTLILSHSPQG